MTSKSFKKNIFIRFLFQIPVHLRGFIVLPLLTRTYPQEVYGVWLQIILLKEILIPLLSLRLETVIIRYLAHEENKTRLIKSVFTITLCCCIFFIASLILFPDSISSLLFGTNKFHLLLFLASTWISILACMHVGLVVLRSQEKIKKLSLRELLSTLWMIASVTVAYLLRLDVNVLIVLCIIGDFILLVWTMRQIGIPVPLLSPISAISNVKKYFSYAAPLIFNSLFLWFTKSIDRFLIIHLIGLATFSVYGVGLQIAGILAVVLSPINFVLFPRATASWKPDGKDEAAKYFSQALTMTLIFSAPVMVGLLAVSGGLVPLLAGPAYAFTTGLLFFLLISAFSTMVYQNHIYVIHLVEKTYFLPIIFIFTAALNFALGYFLISKYSLIGAGLARCATMVAMGAIITIWAKKYIKFSLPWLLIIKTFAAALLMGIAIYLLPTQTWKQLIVVTISGVLIYVLLLIIFRVITMEALVKLRNSF